MGSNNHGKDSLAVIETLRNCSGEGNNVSLRKVEITGSCESSNNTEINSAMTHENREKQKFPEFYYAKSPPRHITLCPFTGHKLSEESSDNGETFFQEIFQALDDEEHDKLECCTPAAPNQVEEFCFTENGLLFVPFESSTKKEQPKTDNYQNETDLTNYYLKVAENLTRDALSVLETISPPSSPI